MLIYLAGPMRGLPLFNFQAFFSAAMALRAAGHEVINPAEHDMALGMDPSNADLAGQGFDLEAAFAFDLRAVTSASGMVLLPNWVASQGVAAELVVAYSAGTAVYEYDTARPDLMRPIELGAPEIRWPSLDLQFPEL